MKKKLIYLLVFSGMATMALAEDFFEEAKKHLEQANKALYMGSITEIERLGHWCQKLVREDKKMAKSWLKKKIDRC